MAETVAEVLHLTFTYERTEKPFLHPYRTAAILCEGEVVGYLGQDKYDWLGREYKLPEILPPEPEHMELLKKAVHSVCDLDCQIGG